MGNKNYTLQLYRYIMCMVIAYFHFHVQYLGTTDGTLSGGYLGVDFFFILSGFLMPTSKALKSDDNVALEYVINKIRKIYPMYIVMMIVFAAFNLLQNFSGGIQVLRYVTGEMWDILFLGDIGIPDVFMFQGSIWFLTSLFINSYAVSYIYTNYNKLYWLISPVSCICLYGVIGKMFGSLSMQSEWIGPLYGAFVRGWADVNIGVIAYRISESLQKSCNRKMRYVFSIIEVLLLVELIRVLNIGFAPDDFNCIICFSFLIMCAWGKWSFVSSYLNCKKFDVLGKLSMPIYLSHLFCSLLLTLYFPNRDWIIMQIIYCISVNLMGVLLKVTTDAVMKKITVDIKVRD